MARRLLVLSVQSVSDIITNSSSEVFVIDTDKTCEEVDALLNKITSGFCFPEVFHLKDYREWRKKLRSGEIEEDWSYPGSIFNIANGWLKDPEDEEDVFKHKADFLFHPFEVIDFGDGFVSQAYGGGYYEPVHETFTEYLREHWDEVKEWCKANKWGNQEVPDHIDIEQFLRNTYLFQYSLPDEFVKEFIDNYKGIIPDAWGIPPKENVINLDGKVLVVSSDENSIPYDTWDEISKLFDCWNIHLG